MRSVGINVLDVLQTHGRATLHGGDKYGFSDGTFTKRFTDDIGRTDAEATLVKCWESIGWRRF